MRSKRKTKRGGEHRPRKLEEEERRLGHEREREVEGGRQIVNNQAQTTKEEKQSAKN